MPPAIHLGAALDLEQPSIAAQRDVVWQDLAVTTSDRAELLRQTPFVLWFTGLSGAGKTTLANLVARRLHDLRYHAYVLDGDNLRHGLNRDLGFTDADRQENVRRMAEVSSLVYDSGLIVLTACISPFATEREFARNLFPPGRFVEIFADAPLELCEQRDNKGLYRRARAGEISDFTGIDSRFERPNNPELVMATGQQTPSQCADAIMAYLRDHRLIAAGWTPSQR